MLAQRARSEFTRNAYFLSLRNSRKESGYVTSHRFLLIDRRPDEHAAKTYGIMYLPL